MRNKPYPLYEIPMVRDLKELVKSRTNTAPTAAAFAYSKNKNRETKTFSEFSEDIDALGTYFYSIGLKDSHIAIISENSYEWILAFFAAANGGNVVVPIDKEQPPELIGQLVNKSDCSAVIYSNTYSETVNRIDGVVRLCMSDFDEYMTKGKGLLADGEKDYIDYNIDAEALAAIFFTSGTTGYSKGVMLSHKNMVSDTVFACRTFQVKGTSVAVLPFHHTFGFITAILGQFCYGYTTYICGDLKRVQTDFKEIKPRGAFLVPLFVETFYKGIIQTAKKNGKYKTLMFAAKMSNFLLKIGIDLRKKLFSSVQEAFGGNLEYVICGGAFLDTKYIEAFRSWGINIYNGYGITECSPVVSVNRNCHWKDGSVGKILSGCDVRIADDAEVLVKGDNVMLGYYKDCKSTADAIKDGWYSTGDLGYVDADNFLFLTGRKKNLIILSNGENVSPEEIERRLLAFDEIQEVVVYSDNGIVTAEIFPTEDYIGNERHFKPLINEANRNQPPYRQINKIKLRSVEFEKNSTKKILRHKITGGSDNDRQN